MIGSTPMLTDSQTMRRYKGFPSLKEKQKGPSGEAVTHRQAAREEQRQAVPADFTKPGPRISLLPLLHVHGKLPALHGLVGLDENGTPLTFDFSRRQSWHLLVDGPSGSGKSNVLRTCAAAMALSTKQSQLQYIALDPGGRDMVFLEACPHMLTDLVSDWLFTEEILQWLIRETSHRQRYRIVNPHLFLWIDDLHLLYRVLSRAARQRLVSLWEKGPEFGIHIAVSMNSRITEFKDIFPSLASSVHISLMNRQPAPAVSAQGFRSVLHLEGNQKSFEPVLFFAREMNIAADLLRTGFRLIDGTLLMEGGADAD
ncbi:MAG: hypothetical protein JXA25_07935 [Anaerolineales bacterium]|nr:hypothetical protein [Anaerolineales bacterium]